MNSSFSTSTIKSLSSWAGLKHLPNVIPINRKVNNSIASWISSAELASPPSRFSYGVPPWIVEKLSLPLDSTPIISDVLTCIYEQINISVNYLEIGTSVGKTAYILMSYAIDRQIPLDCICLDIEEINPTLLKLASQLYNSSPSRRSYSEDERIKRMAYAFSSCHDTENSITFVGDKFRYVCGDEFDMSTWDIVKVNCPSDGFNVIYSDALHSPAALMMEYSQLKHCKLLSSSGIYYLFDDLESDLSNANKPYTMWSSVIEIAKDLSEDFSIVDVYAGRVHGWLGQHEYPHGVGLIVAIN